MRQHDSDQMLAEFQQAAERATLLKEQDPKLGDINAFIIARDMLSSDRSLQWLRDGTHDWGRAEVFCGSYGRLDLRVRAHGEGLISDEQAMTDLAATWSGSDPDDTDPRFLALWKAAFAASGRKYLRDREGKALPRGHNLVVFRGQDKGAPFGLSWSLDFNVALKFAKGAATRQHNRDGVVYRAFVSRPLIMGYMTGRGENEVIIDPADLRSPTITRS